MGTDRATGVKEPHPLSKEKKRKKTSESKLVRTSYASQVRIAKVIQMLFEQQERDNGVRPWMTTAHIAHELGDSVRTISEAIARMRIDYDLPVHYVEKRKGIGFTEKVTSIPTMVCSQSESMGLCVAMLGLSIHAGTPYAAGARSIAKKLTFDRAAAEIASRVAICTSVA